MGSQSGGRGPPWGHWTVRLFQAIILTKVKIEMVSLQMTN